MDTLKLGNSFVPKTTPVLTSRLLSRLKALELVNIALLWLTIPQTVPKPTAELLELMGQSKPEFISAYKQWLEKLKVQKGSISKRRVVDKLIVDIYPKGLNLLQLATLDSQLIVSKTNAFQWFVTTVTSHDGAKLVTNIDSPQDFLQCLVDTLSTVYLTHIYISRHPHYPLIIIRIQLFDFKGLSNTSDGLSTRKPIFVGIPMNSDKLLINEAKGINDTAAEFVVQSLESALSKSLRKEVKLQFNETLRPLQNLESAFIIAGNSRHTESLGPWAPYAAGEVDISPFDDVKLHSTFKKNEHLTQLDVNKRISMMRFKGSHNQNKGKSYEGGKKRLKKNDETVESQHDDYDEDGDEHCNEYSSIVPIQSIEFDLIEEFKGSKPRVKLTFQGSDVFGGLHQLCDKGLANAETIPGWLTGETITSGTISDGRFTNQLQLPSNDGSLI
ncbi:unnamed protein product [Cyberlindnera jadinii]|uniref:CHL4-domain-containing protein n=1 Tax=Cyberlindnera jadinii (strain ATCC 18201 / CBS 1600 / BCRC 20928 / JCM 3617 / NBRC 0987 / NRRL Y-1542) TaxID=983966 RepID=A0A0H5C9P8_CYBJN|nr:CHL4-domain-containing protein [Cyberlindnera jadinii NRRL Y-1542]ODV73892.1 CHL4-domain-containing protein [Cyberlindnera jadinii NRRL Y-1542]CEP25078.1 unnamed protein product [Cyberlindnera jadinii]